MRAAYRVNLLPLRLQREGKAGLRRLALAGGATLLLGLILGSYGVFLTALHYTENSLAETKQQLSSLAPLVARVEDTVRERKALEEALAEYHIIMKNRLTWHALLSDLSEAAPVDLWLTELEINSFEPGGPPEGTGRPASPAPEESKAARVFKSKTGRIEAENSQAGEQEQRVTDVLSAPNMVILKGCSRSVPSVGRFIYNLDRLPYFREVKLKKITSEGGSFSFEINAPLKDDR